MKCEQSGCGRHAVKVKTDRLDGEGVAHAVSFWCVDHAPPDAKFVSHRHQAASNKKRTQLRFPNRGE